MVTASTRMPYRELAAIKMVAVEVRSLIAVSGCSSTKTVAASTQLKVRASCYLNSAGGIFHFNRKLITTSTRGPYRELAAIKMVAVEVRSLIAVEMVAVSGRSSTKTVVASTQLKVRASCDLNSAGGIFHFNRSLVAVKTRCFKWLKAVPSAKGKHMAFQHLVFN